ncbi:MAG: hypothetical protein GQ540_03495 [Lutibacter sp.]|uniref:hypothetical protein n=1 Tax=Lutibacter sp. TaxID=1925666 RepID=UPI0019F3D81C|nr:hypothetical protein [Lutibacter sp.]NOR27577.1 hypothetical protein [Lutibacter sp.]
MNEIKKRIESIIEYYENELEVCKELSLEYPEFDQLEQGYIYKKCIFGEIIESLEEMLEDYF